jgi:hypothetical protein
MTCCLDERMNEWMDGYRVNEKIDARANECIDE